MFDGEPFVEMVQFLWRGEQPLRIQSDRDERQGTDAVGLQLQFLTCMAMASTFEFIPEKIVPNFVSDQGWQFVGGKHRQSRAGDLGRLDAPAIRYELFFAVSPDEKTTFYVKRKQGDTSDIMLVKNVR